MPRQIIFDPEARLEFEEAVEWHNERDPGAGDRLEAEVYQTLERLLENPERHRLVGATIRTARLKIFRKYSIYFHVEPEFIGLISVFHGSRNPEELRRRLR